MKKIILKPILFKKILKYLAIIIIPGLLIILLINLYVLSFSKDKILSNITNLEQTKVGLVFGSRVLNKKI